MGGRFFVGAAGSTVNRGKRKKFHTRLFITLAMTASVRPARYTLCGRKNVMFTLMTLGVFAFVGPVTGLLFVLFLAVFGAIALVQVLIQREIERRNDPYTPAYDACEKIVRERELERLRIEHPHKYYRCIAFCFVCLVLIFTAVAAYLPGLLALFPLVVAYGVWKEKRAESAAAGTGPATGKKPLFHQTKFFDPGKICSRDEVVGNFERNLREHQERKEEEERHRKAWRERNK